jgi:hypothetical protein
VAARRGAQRAQRNAEVAAVLDFFQRSTGLPRERVAALLRVQNPRLWATFAATRRALLKYLDSTVTISARPLQSPNANRLLMFL